MASGGSASSPDADADADALYSRATVAEHAGEFDVAFGLYLSAAQAFLHQARSLPAQREADRSKCKVNAGTCLERAERIKTSRKDALKPLVRDPFSKVWRRPFDVYGAEKILLAGPTLEPRHIHQNVVSDCSVCSAAAICLHHHRMFNSKLGLSCMHPHTPNGLPSISSDGTYTFRFFMNGSFRRVSIDDRLPFSGTGQQLSVIAILESGIVDMWPALLEKAYLKLMGGYDFPGSVLTGWIPEHIEINSSTFEREKAFRRICEGFNRGSCVLTLGTGPRATDVPHYVSALDGSQTKLLPAHSYAVLSIHEESDGRYLTILNPWNGSQNTGSEMDVCDTIRRLQIDDQDASDHLHCGDTRMSVRGAVSASANLIDVFWDEICNIFDGLYLNWDPALFKHSHEFHGSWRTRARENTPECVRHYLYLDLVSEIGEMKMARRQDHELWVLLTRHIVDKHHLGEFIALHVVQVEQDETRGDDGAVHAALDLKQKGLYTSSTHTLTRLAVTGPRARVALIASYDGPYTNVCFSVQVYCDSAELTWIDHPRKTAYERLIEGTFSSRNAGGNSTYPTFMNNPQYWLRLHSENVADQAGSVEKMRKGTVRLTVEGQRDVPFNAMLIWRSEEQSRERVFQLRSGDMIASSGPYSYGVAQTIASVTPGHYCIVVSTFEPRHRGKYTLCIESAMRMDLEDIPAEGAGMFCKTVRGAWHPGMDGGSPRFCNYDRNPMFEISAQAATVLKLRLQLTKPSAAIALNVTLFASPAGRSTADTSTASSPSFSSPLCSSGGLSPHASRVALERQIATSGAYVDGSQSPAGVVTPQTAIAPGKYVAVVSTFDPGIHAPFQLLVFSKTDIKVSLIQ
ncbi:cysteine proteinase [Sanghuangporus baumii]|uniref:Cysteine proteinase n=1 Tax=Sanghuangporus baumii TaxID=108892 RepID=A0A9Q5NDR2_SANBA|nr:cysteine proteinase [Sanghuangporus baumii]